MMSPRLLVTNTKIKRVRKLPLSTMSRLRRSMRNPCKSQRSLRLRLRTLSHQSLLELTLPVKKEKKLKSKLPLRWRRPPP